MASLVASPAGRTSADERLHAARAAADRARRLQGHRLSGHLVEVHPALASLLPDHGLRTGCTYGVDGSNALLAALLAAPSSKGLWCAVVGLPHFALEAAQQLGCDLDRVVLVPDPGRDWVNVVAALIDALTVVVVRPTGIVSPGEAARLGARLRQREGVLIATGPWPRTETRLAVRSSRWVGLGEGHGNLVSRRVTVGVSGRSVSARLGSTAAAASSALWLPDSDGRVRMAAGDDTVATGSTSGQPGAALLSAAAG